MALTGLMAPLFSNPAAQFGGFADGSRLELATKAELMN